MKHAFVQYKAGGIIKSELLTVFLWSLLLSKIRFADEKPDELMKYVVWNTIEAKCHDATH